MRQGKPQSIIFRGDTEEDVIAQYNKFMSEHTNIEVKDVTEHNSVKLETYEYDENGRIKARTTTWQKPYNVLGYTEYEIDDNDTKNRSLSR